MLNMFTVVGEFVMLLEMLKSTQSSLTCAQSTELHFYFFSKDKQPFYLQEFQIGQKKDTEIFAMYHLRFSNVPISKSICAFICHYSGLECPFKDQ